MSASVASMPRGRDVDGISRDPAVIAGGALRREAERGPRGATTDEVVDLVETELFEPGARSR